MTVDLAPERSGVKKNASPIGREAERRARESASSAEDGEGAPRALLQGPSAPPTLRLEVLSGVSRGDAVSASPGIELLTVGRGETRDLCVGDVEVSSSHAEFRWTWFTAFPAGDAGASLTRARRSRSRGSGRVVWRRRRRPRAARRVARRGRRLHQRHVLERRRRSCSRNGARDRNANPWRALRTGDEIRLGERAESPALRVSLAHETERARAKRTPPRIPPRTPRISRIPRSRRVCHCGRPRVSTRASPRAWRTRSLSECPLRGCADVALFAVFDGHAGADAAERARRVFPEVLAKRLGHCAPRGDGNTPGDAANALRDAFLETDANIRCEYEGCSAAVLLVWRCDATGGVYAQTANVGDAGIVLGRTRGQTTDPSSDARVGRVHPEAHLMTRAHVLADPAERARFVAAGASVAEGTNETVRGLRVSRSVGDRFSSASSRVWSRHRTSPRRFS